MRNPRHTCINALSSLHLRSSPRTKVIKSSFPIHLIFEFSKYIYIYTWHSCQLQAISSPTIGSCPRLQRLQQHTTGFTAYASSRGTFDLYIHAPKSFSGIHVASLRTPSQPIIYRRVVADFSEPVGTGRVLLCSRFRLSTRLLLEPKSHLTRSSLCRPPWRLHGQITAFVPPSRTKHLPKCDGKYQFRTTALAPLSGPRCLRRQDGTSTFRGACNLSATYTREIST